MCNSVWSYNATNPTEKEQSQHLGRDVIRGLEMSVPRQTQVVVSTVCASVPTDVHSDLVRDADNESREVKESRDSSFVRKCPEVPLSAKLQ